MTVAAVTVTRDPIAVPDSTGATFSLLRELRRGRGRKQAASAAYWAYLVAIIVVGYGGSLIVTAYRALRHPPPATAAAPRLLHAGPAALTALALLVFLVLLRDALWRGPVTVPQATADWLLGTPVSRRRLLRPRFRWAAAGALLVGAVAGIVPAAALVALGLGGGSGGEVLRLAGAAMLSMGLLFAVATGRGRPDRAVSGDRAAGPRGYPGGAGGRGRARRPGRVGRARAAAGRRGHGAALVRPVGMGGPAGDGRGRAGRPAGAGNPAPWWPVALGLLAGTALAALACADRVVAGVPAAALRARARTLGAMSAAALSMNTRGVATAYTGAAGTRRARFRLPPPRRRELVLLWRDLLALLRSPARLVSAVLLALLAAALAAVAGHGRPVSLVLVGCALSLGYLAAAWLCEGARLDADDPRRSAQLPFRYESLAWWHAAVPCLVLLAAVGVPAAVAGLVVRRSASPGPARGDYPGAGRRGAGQRLPGQLLPGPLRGGRHPGGQHGGAEHRVLVRVGHGARRAADDRAGVQRARLARLRPAGPRPGHRGRSRGRARCLRGPPRGAPAGRLTGRRRPAIDPRTAMSCLVRLSPTWLRTEELSGTEEQEAS